MTGGGIGGALTKLEAAGAVLRRRTRASIAQALADAWERIGDPERELGRRARQELPESTGLSLPMVVWGLSTTLRGVRGELRELGERMEPPPGALESPRRLGAIILAGNVFVACVQALSVALLAKVPVIVKASSKDDALPRLFWEALLEVDGALAEACLVVGTPGAQVDSSVLQRAEVVSAYGSDATLGSIRAHLDASTELIKHGHGLGLAFVGEQADLERAAEDLSLDVAAYDQRGCMSPHAIAVERGATDRFARLLHAALARRAEQLPRGPLPAAVGALQVQWRGLGAALGELYEGPGWAVSVEGPVAPRISPGWRNVTVFEVADVRAFAVAARTLGTHLKAVGVAGDVTAVADALDAPLAPRVCAAGAMQTPSLGAYADGLPPWSGWRRFVTVG